MKQSSLFRSLPVRSGRMTIIFTASVFAHTCLVGVGAVLWQQSEPVPTVKITSLTFEEPPPDKQGLFVGGPVEPTPLVSNVTPPPVVELPIQAATPPEVDPTDMVVPTVPPKPRVATTVRAVRTNVLASPSRNAAASTTVGNGSPVWAGQPNGEGSGSVLGWKTPRPPYPRSLLLARVQGTTTVRFTTDALGNVASASIVKSTGNAALDAATLSYVRANWRGPANAARTTEFVYELP